MSQSSEFPYVHDISLVDHIFVIENIIGGSLLAWSLFTALFFTHLRRRGAWISLYTALLLNATSSLLLFFTKNMRGVPPPMGLCVAQAMMMYTASFLCGATVFSLSLQVWLVIKGHDMKNISVWLVGVPWGMSLTIVIISLVIGMRHKDGAVRQDSPYCWIVNRVPAYTTQILVMLSLLSSLVLQVMIVRRLWIIRSAPSAGPNRVQSGFNSASRRMAQEYKPVATTVRLTIFCVAAMTGIAYCLASFTKAFMDVPHIIQGAWPLMGFMVFGFRMDFLRAWLNCCRREQDDEEDDDHDLDSVVHVYDPTMVDIRLGQYGGHGQPGGAVQVQAHARDDSRGSRGDAESAVSAIMKPAKVHVW